MLLGVLSATDLPKFINLTDEALFAKVKANAAALKSGVDLANMKWRLEGSPTGINERNDIQLYGTGASGQIDINAQGFPAQSYSGPDSVLDTNNDNDCLSLWEALIEDGASKAAIVYC